MRKVLFSLENFILLLFLNFVYFFVNLMYFHNNKGFIVCLNDDLEVNSKILSVSCHKGSCFEFCAFRPNDHLSVDYVKAFN